MESLGPYLLKRVRFQEGTITVHEGQDVLTGAPVLVYRPVEGPLPKIQLDGILPWKEAMDNAWVAELPFGAVPAERYRNEADLERLLGWARRLLATLLEAHTLGFTHGRLGVERLWVKGPNIWIEGLGVPAAHQTPDEVGVVEALKALAGESWMAWAYAPVLEAFAAGNLSLREVAEAFAEPKALEEIAALVGAPGVQPKREEAPAPPADREPAAETPGEVAAPEPNPAPPPAAEPAPPEPPTEPEAEPVGSGSGERPVIRVEDGEAYREVPVERATPPAGRVIRIEESAEPAFDVLEPPKPTLGRWVRGVVLGLVFLGVVAAGWFWFRPAQPPEARGGYVVWFNLEPQGHEAVLELVEPPPGSSLAPGGVIAEIPGPVSFDVPGAYRLRIQAAGYRPKEILLSVPPEGRGVTVRLESR